MKETLLPFYEIITRKTGLLIRGQDMKKLDNLLHDRMTSCGIHVPEDYYAMLQAETSKSQKEWQELIIHLTTGETYFFRDKGQFELLKNWVIPELIGLRKKEKALRIWSAGCSTGEEPYSLAILIDQMIPRQEGWNILILGTDINHEALQKARDGVYGEWSFRGMGGELRNCYFHKSGSQWKLEDRIRRMVTFEAGNLMSEPLPEGEIRDMDLILCRNVFIYFDRAIVSEVIGRMALTLREGGYLLTGHAEFFPQTVGLLNPRIFPESVIYQYARRELPVKPLIQRVSPPPVTVVSHANIHPAHTFISRTETEGPLPVPLMEQAQRLFQNGNPATAIEKLKELIKKTPRHFEAHYLLALAYANRGEDDKASEHCRKALEIQPFNAGPHYLLAQLAHEKGEIEYEKKLLKKVIYLEPSHVAAYIELGSIYDDEGEMILAQKMRAAALELLRTLPPQSRVEPYAGFTVEELSSHLRNLLPLQETR